MVTIIPASRGVRHTTTWEANNRPQNPREGLTYQYINGDLPLTAMLGMMKTKKPKDTRFSHYTKTFPCQIAAVTDVYTDAGLSSAYAAGSNAIGLRLFVKVDNTQTDRSTLEFRPNHVVMLRNSADPRDDTPCVVLSVSENGANSYIEVKTLKATTTTTTDPAAANLIKVIGNAQEQGSTIPGIVNYNSTELYNYTQIFWTPYSVTRTQTQTEILTGDVLKEERREKSEIHGVEMEKAFWWGERYKETVDGKEKTYTQGIIPMILEYADAHVFDYRYDTDFSGQTWEEGGLDWLTEKLEIVGRYGKPTRSAALGSVARMSFTKLGLANAYIYIEPDTAEYGLDIERWRSPNGMRLNLMTHPLFSQDTTDRSSMVLFDMANLQEMALQNTTVTKDTSTNVDGIKEGYLTETGLEYSKPIEFAYFKGLGQDNLV